MLGAYFSSSGTPIYDGAAGLGEYFDVSGGSSPPPAVTAFQEGVFGGGSADVYTTIVGDDPGPLMAYRDGSLGACAGCGVGEYEQAAAGLGYPLYIDGKPVDAPITIYHGPPAVPASVSQLSPTPYNPNRGRVADHMSGFGLYEGPLMAYRDGSLGACAGCGTGAFGAVGMNPKVVDLTNPGVLKEVKAAIGLFVPEIAMVDQSVNPAPNVGPKYYDTDFYESPIWDAKSEELWAAARKKLTTSMKLPDQEVSQSSQGHNYPTPAGLSAVIAAGVGAPVGDPNAFKTNFPNLYEFQMAVVAAKGSLKDFKVLPPFFTVEEKVKGKSTAFAGMSTSVLFGIGAVVAVGAFLLLRK
jgi:hypothetical protein